MAQSSLRQSDLVAFDNAAAGHDGVLSDASGSVVIKPCTAAEVSFYESANASRPDFARLMPTFMGTLQLSADTDLNETAKALVGDQSAKAEAQESIPASSEAPDETDEPPAKMLKLSEPSDLPAEAAMPSDIPAAPGPAKGKKLDTGMSIVLSNSTAGFKRPNVLDVKLGARLWDAGAKEEKRARLDQVSSETTSGSLGFRIAGMKVWRGETSKKGQDGIDQQGYKDYGKMYGRAFNADDVLDGFREFFIVEEAGVDARLGRVVLGQVLTEVKRIRDVLEAQESRMIGASILVVYEGAGEALATAVREAKSVGGKDSEQKPSASDEDDDDESNSDGTADNDRPKMLDVKLIDFAHASWTPGEGPDENALQGVRSVVKILEDILVKL
ncbi:MAG: hypothetical protein M1817_005360 [Caeruleum heppii]|nr:MAG: hypothetical protein M1817_005360 [Caeruleum heppii]